MNLRFPLLAVVAVCYSLQPGGLATLDSRRPPLIVAPSEADPRAIVALTHASRYSFMAPRDWPRAVDTASQSLRLDAPGQDAHILVQFRDVPPPSSATMNPTQWHRHLQDQHPGAQLLDNFSTELLSSRAHIADLSWLHLDSLRMHARFIRVPLQSGHLDISLIGESENFDRFLPTLMQLLGSLQIGSLDSPLLIRPLGRE